MQQIQTWDVPAMQYSQAPAYSQQAFVTQETLWIPSPAPLAPTQVHDFQEIQAYASRRGMSPMRQQHGPLLPGIYSGVPTYLSQTSPSPSRQAGTPVRMRNSSPMTVRHQSPSYGRHQDMGSVQENAPRLLKQPMASNWSRDEKERYNEERRKQFINQTLLSLEAEKQRTTGDRRNQSNQSGHVTNEEENDIAPEQPFRPPSSMPPDSERGRYLPQQTQETVVGRSDHDRIEPAKHVERQAPPEIVCRQVIKEVPVEVVKEVVVVKEIVKEVPVEKIVIQEVVKEVQVVKEVIREIPQEKVIIRYIKANKETDIQGLQSIFSDLQHFISEVFVELKNLRETLQKQEKALKENHIASSIKHGVSTIPQTTSIVRPSTFSAQEGLAGHVQQQIWSLTPSKDPSLEQLKPVRERWKPERERARPELDASSTANILREDTKVPPRLTGLGMRLERREGSRVIFVEEIISGFAADLCGYIAVGDVVESIDGQDVTGWSLDMLKGITVGPVGSSCCVRIRRDGELYDLNLTRAVPQKISEGTSQQEAHAAFAKR